MKYKIRNQEKEEEWYNQFKKGDWVECNITLPFSPKYRWKSVRVKIPLVSKSKSKITTDKESFYIYNLWVDGEYQFDEEGKKLPWRILNQRNYCLGIQDNVVKIKSKEL